MPTANHKLRWRRVLTAGELPEGRVKTMVAGHLSLAMVKVVADAESI